MSLLDLILPKRKSREKGTSATATFQQSNASQALAAPQYREHIEDLFSTRLNQNSLVLLKNLFRQDPDLSAAVNAYLTVADTEITYVTHTLAGEIDPAGQEIVDQLILGLTTQLDYSEGFRVRQTLRSISENLRYMLLLRGACAAELVLNKKFLPYELRMVDPASLIWYEKSPGQYKPAQEQSGGGTEVSLDIPTFFVTFFRRDPTDIYTYSHFVSSINIVAARTQVINDLYRILRLTGFPRIEVTVLEEVLRKNAPSDAQSDPKKMDEYLVTRITEIQTVLNGLRADSAFVHTDAIESGIMNKEGPRSSLDVKAVIEVLNSMNQSALKTMATIIGRGEAGVNTASVEARVFSLNAQELNLPVAEILSQALTLALRLQNSDSYVEVKFAPVEMRPALELEPQLVVRQTRLLEQLSYGLITDSEYHLQMNGRLPPAGIEKLSGTLFLPSSQKAQTDTSDISPNQDTLGRSVTPDGHKTARSKTVQK